MQPLPIDLDDLILALEEHNPGARNYLDRETGEVIFASDQDPDDEERDGLSTEVDLGSDRYLPIKPVPPAISFQVMELFLRTLPAGRLSSSLANALRQEHPLRRFKEVLSNDHDAVKHWHSFHRQQFMRIAQKWLDAKGIQARHVDRETSEEKLVERNIQNKLGKLMDSAWVPPIPGD